VSGFGAKAAVRQTEKVGGDEAGVEEKKGWTDIILQRIYVKHIYRDPPSL